jgi:uncharacterized protein
VTFLLDVNVLIALADSEHSNYDTAHRWFTTVGGADWATCPTTENSLLRILGNSRYPGSPGSPAAGIPLLERLRSHPGHHFWPEDFSMLGSDRVDPAAILTSARMTDTWLLALAVRHGGQLATFDWRLVKTAVTGGAEALYLMPAN